MKKIGLVFIIILFLLTGCTNKEMSRILIMDNTQNDDGLVLICDQNYQVIRAIETTYPNNFYYQNNNVYILTQDYYQGYNIKNGKEINQISTSDSIITICDNNYYFTYNQTSLIIYDSNNEMVEEKEIDIVDDIKDEQYLYILDNIGTLYVYKLSDGSLYKKSYINISEDMMFTLIEHNVYLVDGEKITRIVEGTEERTYLFSLDIDYLSDVTEDVVMFMIDNTLIAYKLTFKDYLVNLEMLVDDKYYDSVDYESFFGEYYQNGYSCLYDYEVEK